MIRAVKKCKDWKEVGCTGGATGKVALEHKRPWAALTGWLPTMARCDSARGVLECRPEEARRRPREGGGKKRAEVGFSG